MKQHFGPLLLLSFFLAGPAAGEDPAPRVDQSNRAEVVEDKLPLQSFGQRSSDEARSHRWKAKKDKFRKMLEELDLTAEQQTKFKEMKGARSDTRDAWKEVKTAKRELRSLMAEDSATDEEILERVSQLNQQMGELRLQRTRKLLELRKILTPTQRQKFREQMKQRSQHEEDR